MAKYEVVTQSGSVYNIDMEKLLWQKNSGEWHKLERIALGEWDGTIQNVPNFYFWEYAEAPEVGYNMYIRGRGVSDWFLTTKIVKVTEL